MTVSRIAWGYFTSGFLDVFMGAIIFCYPYVAKSLDSGFLGTLSNAIFMLVYISVCLFVSRVRIFKERRWTMALGSFFVAIGCLFMLLSFSRMALIISPVLSAMGSALFYPGIQPWINEGLDRKSIIRVVAGYAMAWVIGYLCGPFLAGTI